VVKAPSMGTGGYAGRLTNLCHGWLMVAAKLNSTSSYTGVVYRGITELQCILNNPELQLTPKNHPVTTPRFNLAFVKLGNFDEITTY